MAADGSGVWVCPTCRAENVGTVDQGCSNPECPTQTAKPAHKGQAPVVYLDADHAAEAAWQAWLEQTRQPASPVIRQAFLAGWESGAAWSGKTPGEAGESVPEESAEVQEIYLMSATTTHPIPVDAATRLTIINALAFYRDNQLGFGSVPGCLSARQVDEFLAKITPLEDRP